LTLTAGASYTYELGAEATADPSMDIWFVGKFEGLPSPITPIAVYRFYNMRTGTHFYTGTAAERDQVIATLGNIYHYEGVAYTLDAYSSNNITPLYRFYNKRTGTHFYTADETEKNNTVNNLGAIYQLDGIAYYVSNVAGPGATTVYRFYNMRTGTHFYTATTAERDNVINTMGSIFHYEGPAFYAWGPTQ
jgi:lysyl endopeptidase